MKYDVPPRYQPKQLLAEYDADRAYWAKAVELAKSIAKKAAGDWYWNISSLVSQPENFWYTHGLHTKARLTQGTMNPRFTTKKKDQSERVTDAEEFCANWTKDTGFEYEAERIVDDLCGGVGVFLVTQQKRKGYEQFDDPPFTTTAQCWPIEMWGCDPVGGSYAKARHAWHNCVDIKDDFVWRCEKKPDEWDIEAVRRMVPKPLAEVRGDVARSGVDRGEVSWTEFWARDFTLPDSEFARLKLDKSKCHGTVFKFAMCESTGIGGWFGSTMPEMIAPPVPYFGPRQGPYVLGGLLDVPRQVRPSSPLIANGSLIEELNATERAIDVLANSAKTFTVVDGLTPQGVGTIQTAQHGEVVTVAGFDTSRCQTVEVGGPKAELLARAKELSAKVRRNLGMPLTAQGEADGAATLGENEIANAHLELTTGSWDDRYLRMIGEVWKIVAWFSENDERTVAQYDGNTMLGGRTREELTSAGARAERVKMISPDERAQFEQELPAEDETALNFEDLSVTVERVKTDMQSLGRYAQAIELMTGVMAWAPIADPKGLQKFVERGADELQIAEIAGLLSAEAIDQMAIPGAEEEAPPREMAPQEQPQPRTITAPSKAAADKKPAKQASNLRKTA